MALKGKKAPMVSATRLQSSEVPYCTCKVAVDVGLLTDAVSRSDFSLINREQVRRLIRDYRMVTANFRATP
jgi:hypothetical protein